MLLPHTKLKALFASKVCGMKIAQKLICQRGMIFFVCGSDPQHFNTVMSIFNILRIFPTRKRRGRRDDLWLCRFSL